MFRENHITVVSISSVQKGEHGSISFPAFMGCHETEGTKENLLHVCRTWLRGYKHI